MRIFLCLLLMTLVAFGGPKIQSKGANLYIVGVNHDGIVRVVKSFPLARLQNENSQVQYVRMFFEDVYGIKAWKDIVSVVLVNDKWQTLANLGKTDTLEELRNFAKIQKE